MRPFIPSNQDRLILRKRIMVALHPGKQSAITGKELAQLCQREDDRLIRVVIKELVGEGIPIASSVTEPCGYFIVSTEDEAFTHIRILESRRNEIDADIRNFKRACADKYAIPEQQTLFSVIGAGR